MNKKELSLIQAEQQFTGAYYALNATSGKPYVEIAEAMGLTKDEWKILRKQLDFLSEEEKEDIDYLLEIKKK